MSFKTILVHVEANPTSDQRLSAAIRVAEFFDGALFGIGAESLEILPLSPGYSATPSKIIEDFQSQLEARLRAAESRFRECAGAAHRNLQWVSAVEYPVRAMALHARGADLVVANRPSKEAKANRTVFPADLVMETGLPVLLVPGSDVPLQAESVVVAWKDTRETHRAVTDALPFLKRAKRVTIVEICEKGGADRAAPGLAAVAQRLSRHGIHANTEVIGRLRGSIAQDLEAAADVCSADLIVAGAYGHSRLREWVLGGVTHDFVAGSSRYLLLSR